jgi:hypothetical protein
MLNFPVIFCLNFQAQNYSRVQMNEQNFTFHHFETGEGLKRNILLRASLNTLGVRLVCPEEIEDEQSNMMTSHLELTDVSLKSKLHTKTIRNGWRLIGSLYWIFRV